MAHALTLADVARELGRSESWLHANWEKLVAQKRLPPPLIEGRSPTWSAAQVYAVQDKVLTPAQRLAAAAFRAALEAARLVPQSLDDIDDMAASRARLDQRFGGQQ